MVDMDAARRAARRLQDELRANAPAIGAILDLDLPAHVEPTVHPCLRCDEPAPINYLLCDMCRDINDTVVGGNGENTK